MSKLEIGQRIETSYHKTGPYEIRDIIRGCTCTHCLDEMDGIDNPLPPHVHLTLRDERDGKPAYLNYYDEETLAHVRYGDEDKIILLPNSQPIQVSLL
jgi:hypothetical protein